jgi:hypothetical protein
MQQGAQKMVTLTPREKRHQKNGSEISQNVRTLSTCSQKVTDAFFAPRKKRAHFLHSKGIGKRVSLTVSRKKNNSVSKKKITGKRVFLTVSGKK